VTLERVATLSDLWIGELRAVIAAGRRIVLARLEDSVHAYADWCPHQRFPLSAGRLEHGHLTCAAHGWVFDAASGCGLNPARARLTSVPVVIQGDDVLVDPSGLPVDD
jgi:toluene monooxygenase system ferredoxin subunit